jgi:PAS domain S-box-containing protein
MDPNPKPFDPRTAITSIFPEREITGGIMKKLLLVEDDAVTAVSETRLLEKAGYGVIHALNGENAVAYIESSPDEVDLVLLDIDLGKGMDGIEAARRILEIRDIPIVFLSSHTEKDIVEKTEEITSYGYVVKNTGETVLLTSIKMAFRLFEAHHAVNRKNEELIEKNRELTRAKKEAGENNRRLKELENRHRALIENSPEAIIVQTEGKLVYVNPSAARLFGADSPEDLTGLHALDLFPPEYHEIVRERIRILLKEKNKLPPIETIIRCRDGKARHVEMFAVPVRYDGKDGSIAFYRDVSEKKISLRELEAEKHYFKDLFNKAPVAIAIVDKEDRVINCNREFTRLFLYNPEETSGVPIDDLIVPPNLKSEGLALKQTVTGGVSFYHETTRMRKDGTMVSVGITSTPINFEEQGFAFSMYQDIGGRVSAEKKVSSLLAEKDLLLREVHHRIKNNMSVMTSLISLHRSKLKDKAALGALKDLEGTLRSMGVLYEKLYRAEDLRAMRIKEFLPDLVEEIAGIFPNRDAVEIETRCGDFILDVKFLSTLSIILNELLTNSMKHAFVGRESGLITVSTELTEKGFAIIFEDNGIGLPDSIDTENPAGFGLELVGHLIQQINGTLRIERDSGTRYVMEFSFE